MVNEKENPDAEYFRRSMVKINLLARFLHITPQ